jgi:hypothetical protein
MNPHKQKKPKNKQQKTIIKTTQIKINRKIKNKHNELQSQQSD